LDIGQVCQEEAETAGKIAALDVRRTYFGYIGLEMLLREFVDTLEGVMDRDGEVEQDRMISDHVSSAGGLLPCLGRLKGSSILFSTELPLFHLMTGSYTL
jgi:hypothetical protein